MTEKTLPRVGPETLFRCASCQKTYVRDEMALGDRVGKPSYLLVPPCWAVAPGPGRCSDQRAWYVTDYVARFALDDLYAQVEAAWMARRVIALELKDHEPGGVSAVGLTIDVARHHMRSMPRACDAVLYMTFEGTKHVREADVVEAPCRICGGTGDKAGADGIKRRCPTCEGVSYTVVERA